MFLSSGCEYAIQTILYLARCAEAKFISVKNIAENNNLSYYFLGKVVQKLTKKGLLISYKGPNGGVGLARKAEDIYLLQIVEAIDGLDFYNKCLIGLPKCDENHPCPIHNDWTKVREEIYAVLKEKSIKQFIEHY